MTKNKPWSAEVSRRSVLHGVACAAGAAPILLVSTDSAWAAKLTQASVGYQNSQKGDQSCSNCALFVPPSSCKTVEDPISANGWCKIWVKKAA
jgi:High potential iron-sulfur protein